MAPHSRPGSTEPHVVDRLVEYLSGSLTPDDDVVVESHLLACAACRAEYEELGPVALMMARQSDDALIDATLGERASAPRSPVAAPSRGASGPGRDHRDDPQRPPRARRDRLRRLVTYAAVLVVGAALGVGVTIAVDDPDARPLQTIGEPSDISTDRLSVSLVEVAGGTEVRAAAVGLRSGRSFQLVAVSIEGRAYVVATGVADGGPQSIVGTVPIAESDIVFVALVEDTNGALLIARPN